MNRNQIVFTVDEKKTDRLLDRLETLLDRLEAVAEKLTVTRTVPDTPILLRVLIKHSKDDHDDQQKVDE